jgi:hypothetical protein
MRRTQKNYTELIEEKKRKMPEAQTKRAATIAGKKANKFNALVVLSGQPVSLCIG